MTSYQIILAIVVPLGAIAVAAALLLSRKEQTASLRALPRRLSLPIWLVRPVLGVFALLFFLSAPGAMLSMLAGNAFAPVAGVSCFAVGAGLLLRRRFAFAIAYVLLAAQGAAHALRLAGIGHRDSLPPMGEHSAFAGVSYEVSRVPAHWGYSSDLTSIAVYAFLITLLAMAHRRLNRQRALGVELGPTPRGEWRVLKGFQIITSFALIAGLAIAGLGVFSYMTYEEVSSPGDMGGGGLWSVVLMVLGAIVAIIAATGLVVALSVRKPPTAGMRRNTHGVGQT